MSPISLRARVSNYRSLFRIALFAGIALFTAWATFTGYSAKLEGSKDVPNESPVGSSITPNRSEANQRVNLNKTYGKLPLSFEANNGQTDPSVKYFVRGPGYNIFFTGTEAVLVFPAAGGNATSATTEDETPDEVTDPDPGPVYHQKVRERLPRHAARQQASRDQGTVVRMRLVGTDTKARSLQGLEELPGKVNYFFGDDESKWKTNVPTYSKVAYRKIYPGIDLVFYGNQQQLEYDLVVAPGADPNLIQIAFDGADSLRVDKEGNLLLKTRAGEIQQNKPTIFQEVDGKRKEIKGSYVLKPGNKIGFKVSRYDRRKPLVIDPILRYLSFVNAGGEGIAITTDAAGNSYFTGLVFDADLTTTPGAYQIASAGGWDAFVTKLNSTGTGVFYTTFLGGGNDDYANGITVDAAGNAYLAGAAGGSFPTTPGAFQTTSGGFIDSFITKLNPTGSGLVFSTLLGGNGFDEADNIAIDPSGVLYVSGLTGSSNLLTTAGAFRTTSGGGYDGYVAKMNAGGTAVTYLTYVGGGGYDYPIDMTADGSGNVYLAGQTGSLNFPTQNAIQGALAGASRGFFKSTNAAANWSLSSTNLKTTYVYSMAINPTTPSTIYAGTDGGVHKTTNSGGTWSATGSIPVKWVRQLLIDPTSTDTIYAGTEFGVFKSTDGGNSWVARSNGMLFANISADIRGLALHPSTPNTIYAAGFGGVFKTTDGGANWVAIEAGLPGVSVANTNGIVVDPSAPNTVYVSVTGGTQRVYKTVNGGASWTPAGAGMPSLAVNALAINPTNPATLYAATNLGVYRTTNGGTNWSVINTGLLLPRSDGNTTPNPSITAIAIDPANPANVYAAPNNTAANNGSFFSFATIFKSVDGGNNWTAQTSGFNNAFTGFASIAVDPTNPNNVYTGSFGDTDGFLLKLNATGAGTIYSTYLGGERIDHASGVALDSSNNVYVSGRTGGNGFPTTGGAFQTTLKGFSDYFVTKFNASGNSLAYSTYLGGTDIENASGGLAVDDSGNAYVTGSTFAADFPVTPGAFQTTIGNPGIRSTDIFVTKLNPSGSALVYSSYLGGGGADAVNNFFGDRLSLDSAANAYVLGVSNSTNFPAFDYVNTGGFGLVRTFVAKIDSNTATFSITGRITTSTSAPIAGVFVEASTPQGVGRGGTTDAQGYYAIINLQPGDYTVTPNRFGSVGHYVYAPPSRAFPGLNSDQTANFTATQVYDIFGQITNSALGIPVFDVTVNLSGPSSASTVSDANGQFAFRDLPAGNYSVTPSKAGFTFSPPNIIYNGLASDQFASFSTTSGQYFTVSGRVATPGNVGISNATVSMLLTPLRGSRQSSAVTDANGNYSFTNLQSGGNYTFLAAKPLLSFTPQNPTLTNLSGSQTLNFTSVPVTGLIGKIAFISFLNNLNVSVMNADTTGETNLTVLSDQCSSDESGPAWSPDGSKLAFSRCDGESDINLYVMKADGTGVSQVTNNPHQELFPSWSPDGNKLTYTFGECSGTDTLVPEIFATDLAGTNVRQLTNNSILDAFSDWSPSGSSIVFARSNAISCSSSEEGIPDLFVMNSGGGNEIRLTNTGVSEFTPVYSPDGSKIAYSREVDDFPNGIFTENIFVMNADGTNQVKITPDTIFAFKPTWSPDGTKLAFQGQLPGVNSPNQIFVVNADGTGLAQLTSGPILRESPAWQHYSISGQLTGDTDGPVTVVLAGTLTRVTQTDANGNYVFGNLTPGGNYTVTPVSTAFTFSPAKIDINNLVGNPVANFTVSAALPTPTPPLNDDFAGAQRDPTKWNFGTQTQPLGAFDPQVSVVQQGGQLVITPRSNTEGLHYNGYVSVNSFDFNNATATVEVTQAASGSADTIFAIGSDLDNFTRFVVRANAPAPDMYNPSQVKPRGGATVAQLIFQVRIGGVLTPFSIPYDPVAHRYFRFRHDPAQNAIVFETSPNNKDFTEQHRVVLNRTVSALTAELSAGTSTPTNPGNAIFDNFQLVTNTFQFAPLSFTPQDLNAGEGASRVSLTVTRVGSNTGAATVEYITRDTSGLTNCNVVTGVASARCDYATSLGLIRFAAGETSKTFTVPLVDDSFAEGPETFTVSVRNANGAGIGTPSRAIVTITDNDPAIGPNPIVETPFFVRQHYVDFLNREPDPAGAAGWESVINNCPPNDTTCDRIHVSSAFFRSAEFQGRGYFVYRFYPVSFGRKPEYNEFIPDLAKVSGFLSDAELEAAKVALINEFMKRSAFADQYNSLNDTQYVDALLSTAGVAPHQFRDFWIAALGNGTRTRATVLRDIAESPEVYNKYYNQAFVVMQYFGYLRRDPDALYLNWIEVLDSTGDFRGMVNGFSNSLEYRFRFGP